MPFLLQVFQQERKSWNGNALYCGSAWAEQGNAAGTRVTGGQSLNILGICIPHNSHLFHVFFREREKYMVELRLFGKG